MSKYVDTLTTFIDRQRTLYGHKAEEQPVGPQPVITIDGVDYYQKTEFHLDQLGEQGYGDIYDLISGERTAHFPMSDPDIGEDAQEHNSVLVSKDEVSMCIFNVGRSKEKSPAQFILASDNPEMEPNYVSHAFELVDSIEDGDSTHICLPQCSAFYGWQSEDRNTFIAYYNLKDEQ